MIRERLGLVSERIDRAASRAGRRAEEILLIGVSKTMPALLVAEAVEAGLSHLGENRVQEAELKIPEVARLLSAGFLPPTWHLIGHLQSNKARKAAGLFPVIHSVDSEDCAEALGRHAQAVFAGDETRCLDILIQVDLGHEQTKHGADEAELARLADRAAAIPGLRLRGLMTIPPPFTEAEASRPFFARLRELRETLAARGHRLSDLSMGMTGDFEVAIEEGATMIRVGRAIFGDRA